MECLGRWGRGAARWLRVEVGTGAESPRAVDDNGRQLLGAGEKDLGFGLLGAKLGGLDVAEVDLCSMRERALELRAGILAEVGLKALGRSLLLLAPAETGIEVPLGPNQVVEGVAGWISAVLETPFPVRPPFGPPIPV